MELLPSRADLTSVALTMQHRSRGGGIRGLLVAGIYDAEAVAVRVGEDDEVGVGRITIPVDPLSAEADDALNLRGLLRGVRRHQIEMHPWVRLGG